MKRFKKIIILSVMFLGFTQLAFSQNITISSGTITNNSTRIIKFDIILPSGTYSYFLCPGASTNAFPKAIRITNERDVTNDSPYKQSCK